MRTRYRVISGALLLLPALLIGGTRLATTRALAEDPAGRLTPEAEERLLADLERLHALGIFAAEGTERDAAPFLNPRINWDRAEQAVGATPASWATDDYESLSRTVTKYSKGVGWLDHPEVTSGYDVSFLADLARYDHWDWQSSDPYLTHYQENPDESGIISPSPNFIPFNRIARVRLAQGYTHGDLPAAMREVEQLAMLVGSTAISASLAVSRCRIPHARAVWARPELSAMWRDGISEVMRHDDVLREPWEQLMSLPYLRQPALAQLLAVVAPNFSGPYGG